MNEMRAWRVGGLTHVEEGRSTRRKLFRVLGISVNYSM